MPDSIPPETIAAIRTLLFARLAKINRDVAQSVADLTVKIDEQNHDASLGLLVYIENRTEAMRNILMVFREHIGG